MGIKRGEKGKLYADSIRYENWDKRKMEAEKKYIQTILYRGTKKELTFIIEQYFQGNKIEKSLRKSRKTQSEVITLETPLLNCGFSFNQKFRDYFFVYLILKEIFTPAKNII